MAERPHVVLSCAMSVDGYIDDATDRRLLLSNEEDFDRVDAVRAGSDAILVGANTVRKDDPRLLVRSASRQAERAARGLPAHPAKVVLTGTGELDPTRRFFTTGDAARFVYAARPAYHEARRRVGDRAVVVDAGDPLDLDAVLADLNRRGVRRLLVEGGTRVHTQFLTAGLVDEIHLVIAPLFVGDPKAPRFVGPGAFPMDSAHRMALVETRQIGDVVLLRYRIAGT